MTGLRFFPAAVSLLIVASCTGPYSGANVSAKASKPRVPIKTFRAEVSPIPEIITATGELFAEETATIGVKAPGRVTMLAIDLGSKVRAGEIVAELEKTDYEFRVRQAEAAVEQTRARLGILGQASDDVVPEETAIVKQADAALREARFIFETTARLQKDGVVSRIEMEKAQVRRQGAEAHYQAALEEVMQLRAQLTERRAQLALARQQLADTTIRAPFSGAVTRRHASLGEYLAVNAPVAMLVRQHPLRLRLEVPERLAAKVRPGQRIDVNIEGAPAGRTGRVVRLSPAIEAQNRSLTIEGELPNEDGRLRPGSFAEAVITVDPDARGIAVPFSSVMSFAGTERVFVVNNGVLDERVVRSGRPLPGDRVQITDGVQPGDIVVLHASDRLVKGDPVTAE